MTESSQVRKPYPLGAHREEGKIRFSFVSRKSDCGILLFHRATGRAYRKIPFAPEERVGNIYCKTVEGLDAEKISYLFYEGDSIVPDEHARCFPGRWHYGREKSPDSLKAGFLTEDFDWGRDRCPRIPYDQALVYCMHVRGFTRHVSSGVKHRGTFAGIGEKIPYLKEIGVTTLELQPAYEFTELPREKEPEPVPGYGGEQPGEKTVRRLNYWGYQRGFYYAPKAAYAASPDASAELKALVKALHENGMELVMQFYFPDEVRRNEIAEILRFWVLEYHVDGFRLMGSNLPAQMLADDEALADTKLWYDRFQTMNSAPEAEGCAWPHTAEYNDGWCYEMRRFLKGDEGMLESVLYQMRHIPSNGGRIHYLTNYCGFTLADLVAYDYKHNEENGEDNRDGNDYNLSWNCGEEGPTRRLRVRRLRQKQMKNAMCLLLLSQSTPLIFMGDEFGNSQRGNNNPYCQDNAVTWLDWSLVEKNGELLGFWKQLTAFRRSHPILHPARELRMMDELACGYPDLSYHGQNAWRPQTDHYLRHIGVMLCGKYAGEGDDSMLYLAFNMHWESHGLALPRPPRGTAWELAFSTETPEGEWGENQDGGEEELIRKIPPRSIAVYTSAPIPGTGRKAGKQKAEHGKDMESF